MPVKIADEYHFEPFLILHHILLDRKLIRHYRGRLRLSKVGAADVVARILSDLLEVGFPDRLDTADAT
jgi:hypothetical protein